MSVNTVLFLGFFILTTCLLDVKSDADKSSLNHKKPSELIENQTARTAITVEVIVTQQRHVISQLLQTIRDANRVIERARLRRNEFMSREQLEKDQTDHNELQQKLNTINSLTAENHADELQTPQESIQFRASLIQRLNEASELQTRIKNRIKEAQRQNVERENEKRIFVQLKSHLDEHKKIELQARAIEQRGKNHNVIEKFAKEYAYGEQLEKDLKNQVHRLELQLADNLNFNFNFYYREKAKFELSYDLLAKHWSNVEKRRAIERNLPKQQSSQEMYQAGPSRLYFGAKPGGQG